MVEQHVEEHRQLSDGWARASIFGMADGLVTNVGLMLGIAGSNAATHDAIRLAGIAGLVAGGFSMASGEYLSMRAQKELFEREIEIERRSLAESPVEERLELIELADELMKDPELALLTHTREELGIDPSSVGSPWRAATGSLVAFAFGALIPLIPWLVTDSGKPIAISVGLGAASAVLLGGGIGRLTGRGVIRSASRFLVISGFAAGVTYLVGHLVG